ncbi:cell wall manno [Trichoderma cornu-damae]|uniref:Cell wall manno n=1 Tax=Trichoderma cornu-damae TaxID=654480 RepID=A0A9P8QPR5_9HYPO|nr:cell wall manno [Trichoderma cornu-damae]
MRHNVAAVGLLALAQIVAGTHCDSSSPCQPSADAVLDCAKPCIESAAVTQAACATGDYQCQCGRSDTIQNAAINCVVGACGLGSALGVVHLRYCSPHDRLLYKHIFDIYVDNSASGFDYVSLHDGGAPDNCSHHYHGTTNHHSAANHRTNHNDPWL